jgi:hypothetical protein
MRTRADGAHLCELVRQVLLLLRQWGRVIMMIEPTTEQVDERDKEPGSRGEGIVVPFRLECGRYQVGRDDVQMEVSK